MLIKFKSGNELECEVITKSLYVLIVKHNNGYKLVSRAEIVEPETLKIQDDSEQDTEQDEV